MQSRNVSGDVGDTCTPRGYVIPKHNRTEASVAAERTGTEGTTEGIATEIKVRPVLATGNFTACRAESLRLLQMGQGMRICCSRKPYGISSFVNQLFCCLFRLLR